MELAPGLKYTARLVPHFLIPSALIYTFLTVGQHHFDTRLPSWIVALLTVIARPVFFFLQRPYKRWNDKRTAAALGAVLPPLVQETPLTIMKEAAESTKSGFPAELFGRWAREYGNTYQMNLLTNSLLFTIEPEHVKAILATQFDDFDKGPIFRDQFGSLLGSGVFNADGDMWKFHRSITRPFFTRERIHDFEIYERNCEIAIAHSKKRLAEGHSIDFQDLVGRFTLDSASEFLFGHNVGSQSAGIPYPPAAESKNHATLYSHPSHKFLEAFTEGQVMTAVRAGLGADWALFEFKKDQVRPLRQIMDNFTEPLIREALEQRGRRLTQRTEAKVNEEENLLAHLVNRTQDQSILKDELVNLLVAGRDTTMGLLTYSMYMLTEHPECEQRLRQEIFDKVGSTNKPTYDNMRELKYTKAFLNEVLRLYPSVPADSRTTNKPVVLPAPKGSNRKPFYIPANTTCVYAVINMHRRTDLWGPDAMKFDPDRFLDERVHKYLTPNPFIFCPFNAGPRICLGQQFAYHEATYYLVRLIQQFTGFSLDHTSNLQPPAAWANCEGPKATEKIYTSSHLTIYVRGGLWVNMRELSPADQEA